MSAGQTDHLSRELEGFKSRLLGLSEENQGLVGEVKQGQEMLRMSAGQIQTLINEIDSFKQRIDQFNRENE